MNLQELLHSAGYPLPPKDAGDPEISGVCANSTEVSAGEIFVAIKGLHTDGFAHIHEALRRGACFVVSEREVPATPSLTVPDAREAHARLLDAFYGHPTAGMKLIGITGTNGKTSVSIMIFRLLRAAGYSTGLIGTVECRINDDVVHAKNRDALANMTTPDPTALYPLLAQMRKAGVVYVVMEVTSHALAFSKVAPLTFACGIFTNLTPDHLDLHGDMESYFTEKKKLFAQSNSAIVSTSTAYGERLSQTLTIPLYAVSKDETLFDIAKNGDRGVSFSLLYNGKKLPFSLPVPGDFSVENGALAAAAGLSLGIPVNLVQRTLSEFPGVPGRLERVPGVPDEISVFLDYAHTPDALEKLLHSVRDFARPEQRILLLFGCGGDRDRTKRPEMGRIGARLADFLILTSDNCRSEDPEAILRDILRGVDKEKPHVVIPDRRVAIAYGVSHARPGDILILAGKGHENYEIRGKERLPFSERELVQKFFREREEDGHAD